MEEGTVGYMVLKHEAPNIFDHVPVFHLPISVIASVTDNLVYRIDFPFLDLVDDF
jgi:hypothetical protein